MAKYMVGWLLVVGVLMAQVIADHGAEKSEQYPLKLRSRAMLQSHKIDESIAEPPAKVAAEAEAPENSRKMGKHHHSSDVAGGGVIIGGLVTVAFAAIYCYIRVTRKTDNGQNH